MAIIRQLFAALALSMLTALSYTPPVIAAEATSSNWGVSEVNFGSGGSVQSCSGSYCSRQSAGELTVGNTGSDNFQAQAGFNTNREPLLEVMVTSGSVDLGTLSETETKFGTVSFTIRNYLSSGYVVYLGGSTPKNNSSGHALSRMGFGASAVGTEQFGINFRDNSNPNVGSNVSQIPDSTFSYGDGVDGYRTVDQFNFPANENEPIAQSLSSSGQTNYTMSMVANIGTTTPAGKYGGKLYLNVVPTF